MLNKNMTFWVINAIEQHQNGNINVILVLVADLSVNVSQVNKLRGTYGCIYYNSQRFTSMPTG